MCPLPWVGRRCRKMLQCCWWAEQFGWNNGTDGTCSLDLAESNDEVALCVCAIAGTVDVILVDSFIPDLQVWVCTPERWLAWGSDVRSLTVLLFACSTCGGGTATPCTFHTTCRCTADLVHRVWLQAALAFIQFNLPSSAIEELILLIGSNPVILRAAHTALPYRAPPH